MTDLENSILSDARILVVEADEAVQRSLRTFFRDITRLFTTIGNAEEALPLLEGPLWDIIVCSLKLPGMNGLEFCSRVRQMKPRTRLILSTQHSNPALQQKAADAGITEIIPAPLVPEKLITRLIGVHLDTETVDDAATRRSETEPDAPETVSILDLDETMIITAFIRFDDQFRKLSPEKCAWIRHNFREARAVVSRSGEEIEIPSEKIKPGDDIVRLHQLPVSLMKLTFVRQKLISELKRRGFLAFEVKRKPTEKTLQQKIRLGAIRRTEEFIGRVSNNIGVRDEVKDAVEAMFDSHSGDSIEPSDLIGHVPRIADSAVAEAICVVSSLKKGDHLYTHCVDVGAIFLTVYTHWVESGGIESAFENNAEIMLSAILHDIGKIRIPAEIRETTEKLDVMGPQMKQMREHTTVGADLLKAMGMPDVTVNMARFHHVKTNISLASSYPPVIDYEAVMLETRLLSVIDTFQALIGQRPYKRSWHPSDAMKYMDNLAGIEYDPGTWIAFRDAIGWYPVGSLVQLNDGSKAFVVERAYHGLHRPAVVVARNADDEELTHNTFHDLNTEKDIFIKKGLDHYQLYGNSAINRFVQLQVS